jgi:signal transduction histidine kinase
MAGSQGEFASDTSDGGQEDPSSSEMVLDYMRGRLQRFHSVRDFSLNHVVAVAVGLVLFVTFTVLVAASAGYRGIPLGSGGASPDASVRALLEGPEIADAAAEGVNLALGGQRRQKEAVRAAMHENFANFSRQLREQYPAEYAQLANTQLDPERQKAPLLNLLRHYGDHRMLNVASDAAQAAKETADDGGDRLSLKRRLTAKLQPRVHDMKQLCHEIYGGLAECSKFSLSEEDVDELELLDHYDRWHMEFHVKGVENLPPASPASAAPPARELTEVGNGQVLNAVGHLQRMLGDQGPSAPLRELALFAKQKAAMEQTTGKERFWNCAKKGWNAFDGQSMKWASALQAAFSCVASTMPFLWSWMSTKFLKLTGQPIPFGPSSS